MKDRVVQYPARYQLVPVAGTTDTFDLVAVPGTVTEAGTDLNKAALLKDATAALFGLTGTAVPDDVLAKLAGGVLYNATSAISALSDGDTFYLNESGSPVEYVKLTDNYEGSGRVLAVRKDALDLCAWNSTGINTYENSTTDTWLNGTFYALLDSAVQSEISSVAIPYTPGNGNNVVSSINRKVFLLSLTEYGLSDAETNTEGAALSYFSDAESRIAFSSGSPVTCWTRSPRITGTTNVKTVTGGGSISWALSSSPAGYKRPAFTLPADFEATLVTAKITDISGDRIVIPSGQLDISGIAKIAMGSYVGSNYSGSGNPNSLTLGFQPKFGIISARSSVSALHPDLMIVIGGYGSTGFSSNIATAHPLMTLSSTGLSWYAESSNLQMNYLDITYDYAFIG